MTSWRETKYRSDETWEQVRRAWESGETASSVARRFDVGIDNLWRRRAKEGWERRMPDDRPPEPVEGWNRYAERKLVEFELRRDMERAVAAALAEAMSGGGLDGVPLWHAGFVLAWRAEHLPPETAARDRAWAAGRRGWTSVFWDEDGRMLPLNRLDAITMRHNRAEWRAHAGLPDGAAETWL
jgi:hypothetical protein